MKKLILTVLLILSFISYSQTTTKKYNNLMERYEYYNSSGVMIGYEEYNSLMEQWEYTDLSQKSNSRVNNYGEPVSTFDAGLAIFALSAAEKNRANKMDNHNRFKNTIERIKNHIDNIENNEVRNNVIENYNKKVANLNKADYNQMLQSTQATTNRINYDIETYNRLYNQAINNYRAKVRESKRYVPKFKYGDYVEVYSYSKIYSEPSTNSEELGKVKNNRVKILSNYNKYFYKVQSGSLIGYISTTWFKSETKNKISKKSRGSTYTTKIDPNIKNFEIKLHKWPSADSQVVYRPKANEEVKIIEVREGFWYKARINDYVGYIFKAYLMED